MAEHGLLFSVATTGSDEERKFAAEALVSSGDNPWQNNGLLSKILLEAAVRERMALMLAVALDFIYPYWGLGPRVDPSPSPTLPNFPWPPPAGHKWVKIPRTLPGLDVPSLGKLYDALIVALSRASPGFEYGLFGGVPNGFALVARMERIKEDGSPYPGDKRWVTEGTPFLSLSEFLGNLFFEKPGYFRVIALVVTNDVNFTPNPSAKVPEIRTGARDMPPVIREQPFRSQTLLALIYTFERKEGAEMSIWEEGAPSGQQHLAAAGIWGALSR